MIARGCTEADMREALRRINEEDTYNNRYGPVGNFAGNIMFKRFNLKGKGFTFTLTVRDSRGFGARINAVNGRHIKAACWHAHGRFFDALFDIAPEARVFSSFFKRSSSGKYSEWITKDSGSWQDGQLGSAMNPVMFSEGCEC